MALDTALKRRSGSAVGRRVPGAGVTPDAAKPAAWRQSAAWGYAGIAPGAPAALPAHVTHRLDAVLSLRLARDGIRTTRTSREGVLTTRVVRDGVA